MVSSDLLMVKTVTVTRGKSLAATLAGTVIGLVLVTPLLVKFSPVQVLAVITLFLIGAGLVASVGFSATASFISHWMDRYATRRKPMGANQLDRDHVEEQTESSGRLSSCNYNNEVDRISDLPDLVLSLILSFLPMKEAVATDIISHRWKFLWKTVTNFNFSSEEFSPKIGEPYIMEPNWYLKLNFVQFVLKVFSFHELPYINKFSLVWRPLCIPSQVDAWIRAAADKNVKELFLSVEDPVSPIQHLPRMTMPKSVFNCSGLKSLELNCKIDIPSATIGCLPNLENLRLVSVVLQGEEALQKLLNGFPVLKSLFVSVDIGVTLEELGIQLELDNDVFKFNVSCKSLKYIEFQVHDDLRLLHGNCLCSIQLDTPSLEYLKVDDLIHRVLLQESVSSLVEANFNLSSYASERGYVLSNYCNTVVETVRGFSCAQVLTVSKAVARALSKATISLSTEFKRLTKLKMTAECHALASLQDFLRWAHNLEVLILKKEHNGYQGLDDDSVWKNPDVIPECMSNILKEVAIDAHGCHLEELMMIGYMLENASALKVMKIYSSKKEFKSWFLRHQQRGRFPVKSPACRLKFIDAA